MDGILTKTASWVPGIAGLVLIWAAIHEWNYHRHHHYAPGPSGILAVGFLASAVVAFAVMFVAKEVGAQSEATRQQRHAMSLKQTLSGRSTMRLAAAIAVFAIALPAALYVHQRHTWHAFSMPNPDYGPPSVLPAASPSSSFTLGGGPFVKGVDITTRFFTVPARIRPSWEDPVALLIVLGGLAVAIAIGPRRRA